MEYFPAPLEALVEQFARLPGIGGKTAQRLAFHVLSLPEEDAQAFADAIVTAKRTVTYCPVCRNFTAGGLCPICSSPSIRLWWVSPLANSPTPVSGYGRPAKSSSLFPVRVWLAQ